MSVSVTFHGSVNANGFESTAFFEYVKEDFYPDFTKGNSVTAVRDDDPSNGTITGNTDTAVQAFVDLLPTPWRGFMLAGFAAAYMSTVATQLNWGASYLVNDFYRRFIKKDGTEAHFVAMSRAAMRASTAAFRISSTKLCGVVSVPKPILTPALR